MKSGRNIVRLSSLQPYILTAVAIALSIPARLLLDPWLGDKLAFVTMFPVVVIAAWWAGPGPAVMATLLGTAASRFSSWSRVARLRSPHPNTALAWR